MKNKIVGIIILLLATTSLVACSKESNVKGPKTATVQSSQVILKKQNPTIVGTYRDDCNKAAILFKKDGTGRYVHCDAKNGNIDTKFTWKKKNSTTFEVTINNKNIKNPLTAKLNKNSLTLTGSRNWNTEKFDRVVVGNLNLDDFLKEDKKQGSSFPEKFKSNRHSVNLDNNDME
ncbi:DUF3642 domain-containing protein [Lactobacillus sp.]|uniref:DUF3642 domain-containing protein n=1 Tax=Lactobacillus sp. TaxID=1591 RepID=UPI00199CDFA5|nr:DUF3642 domain-containing protein [Lactobacillus sp.]MBD5429137.1 hypothetical protein [Lactobacillus sp.]